jgi:LPS sulfotransferase NodH
MSPQNEDGTAHFTYFDKETQLSFVWDGKSDRVEVSHGGYGEPVMDEIRIDHGYHLMRDTAYGWTDWFATLCIAYIKMKGFA